jgi:YihY family inner membrane protein
LGVTGGLGILLGAGSLFGAIESALNRIWCIQGRRWVKGRLVVFVALGVFALVLVAILGVAIFGVRSVSQSLLRNSFPIYGPTLLALVAPPLIDLALFFLAYKFLPNVHVTTQSALVGAFVAMILAEIAFAVLAWYLDSIADYSHLYNTAGAVFALLAWLYALATVFLFGAEVSNAWKTER